MAKKLAILSEEIRNNIIYTCIYIHTEYFRDFVKGSATTIDPARVKLELSVEDDPRSYTEVRCNFWGPCDDFLYFMSPLHIVVVDEEPYVLRKDHEELKEEKRSYLGGNKQNEHFPVFDSLEARTHQNTVGFCDKLLTEIQGDETKDNIMKTNLCILENNFFPALALAGNVSSNGTIMKEWANLFSELLRELMKFYEPNIVLGQRDNLGYCSPVYSGIFNQALGGTDVFRQDENSNQSLIGRKIASAERINTGKIRCSGIMDEKGTLWIGYTYFSRNFWSGYRGDNIIRWIKDHLRIK